MIKPIYSKVFSIAFLISIIGTASFCQSKIDPSKIDIVRDKWGIPHIFAKTNNEVAYGLAWAQSEDDFETIQQTLMFAKGLLGKAYGPGGAAGDFFAEVLAIDQLIEERMDKMFLRNSRPTFKPFAMG